MQHSVGHEVIEEQLFELARTVRFGTLSLEARSLAKKLLSEGYERDSLLDAYESAANHLYADDLDDQAEELLEVMTELEGWCSPHARL